MSLIQVLKGAINILLIRPQHAQHDCGAGSCHPALGDLLQGRSKRLTASSTCGMSSPQKYCIIGYLEVEKCFLCDSRYPYNPYTQHNSHTVENVITAFEPERKKKWWQSENGIDHVSIRLDLETLFQFSHLILTFKTFRPAAMLVERSTDFGQTWKVFRYFAHDCAASFPNISTGPAKSVGDVVCDSRYSDIEPSTEGEVRSRVSPALSSFLPDLITLTNLRINFTKLHTLGDALLGRRHSDPLEKYYYAIYEMVVRGSCFCNGHASQCDSMQNLRGDVFHQSGMVRRSLIIFGLATCNCRLLNVSMQTLPLKPGVGMHRSCLCCNCNSHSSRCHFDMAVYQASGGVSGGVCEDCQDNTTGQHCDTCKPSFYQDPLKAISDPRPCLPCSCDPAGTLPGAVCESRTEPALGTVAGRCPCKDNVEGARCDKCKANYYGLSSSDPLGCQPCNCDPLGTLPFSVCDPATGECLCQRFTTGQRCERCLAGYWGLGNSLYGCSPCDCDIGGSQNNLCSLQDGQCECLPNIVSRQCNEPAPGFFFLPLDYYIYEAEHARPLSGSDPDLAVVFRPPSAGRAVTWTGHGFARVPSGAGLRFAISNVPFAMDFDITVRYEPEVLVMSCASCGVVIGAMIAILQTPVCLEPGTEYFVDVYFSQPSASDKKAKSFILIDSVSSSVTSPLRLYFYTLFWFSFPLPACKCNPQGSLNASCSRLGGQCQCKANVVGRCCDTCSAGSYGFGFHGCYGECPAASTLPGPPAHPNVSGL
uniref:Laminin subunit beta 4 n=1 Tax=Junco hyemalis TaxID=40217 RepID=A0A8C5J7J8_JUNHY